MFEQTDKFETIEVCYYPCLFTCGRLDDNEKLFLERIHPNLRVFSLRYSDDGDRICELGDKIQVNHAGDIITFTNFHNTSISPDCIEQHQESIFPIMLSEEGVNFTGDEMTISDYVKKYGLTKNKTDSIYGVMQNK